MNYAQIKNCDVANGPGIRVSLFVSGCTHHCKGCFNSETWDFNYGRAFDDGAENIIINALNSDYIKGMSLLGGEPFEYQNQKALIPFIEKVKQRYPDKSIWCYTGYDFDRDIKGRMLDKYPETKIFLSLIDVIVDGEFIEIKKNLSLRFRGSSNQRIIDVKKSMAIGKTVVSDEYDI